MGDGGGNLPFAQGWKIAEERQGKFSGNEGEGVAVEEEEGRVFMKLPKEIQCLQEGKFSEVFYLPLCLARCSSF